MVILAPASVDHNDRHRTASYRHCRSELQGELGSPCVLRPDTDQVQRFVKHAGVASATSGAEIAAGYVNRHRYPTTTIIATIAPQAQIHLEIGDGVTIDATDLERLKVPDPASGELWRADLIEISVDGAYLIYSGRFSRRADESRYRELWTQVLKATEDR